MNHYVCQVHPDDSFLIKRLIEGLSLSETHLSILEPKISKTGIYPMDAKAEHGQWIEVLSIAKGAFIAFIPVMLLWLGKGKSMKIKKPDGTSVEMRNISEETCIKVLNTILSQEEPDNA